MKVDLDFRAIVLNLLVGKYGEDDFEKAYKMRRSLKVVLGVAPEPNGLTRRRWLRRGYRITINRGWTDFAYDAACLMISRNQTLDPITEKVLLQPAVTVDQLATQLKRITQEYVRNGAWYSSPIDLKQERRPFSTTFRLPNKLYELMCYFMVAHELGHIFASHLDDRSPRTAGDRWAAELEADRIGAELLLACLGTRWAPDGAGLAYAWSKRFVSKEDVLLHLALSAIAIVFGLMDIWARASHAAGTSQSTYYPSARHRYLALRKHCIDQNLASRYIYTPENGYPTEPVTELTFDRPVFGMSPVDNAHFLWGYLALDINWISNEASFPSVLSGVDSDHALQSIRNALDNTPTVTLANAQELWVDLNSMRMRLDQLQTNAGTHDAAVQRCLGRVMIRLTAAALFLPLPSDALTLIVKSRSHCENLHFLGFDALAAYQLLDDVKKRLIAAEFGEEIDAIHVATILTQAEALLRDAPARETTPGETSAPQADPATERLNGLYGEYRQLELISRYLDDIQSSLDAEAENNEE